jgi:hypothetical protein
VVGVVANPSSVSLASSCRRNCSPEQPSHALLWRAPLRLLHYHPELLINFIMLLSLFSAFPHAKPSLGAPDSVNSGNPPPPRLTASHPHSPSRPSRATGPSRAIPAEPPPKPSQPSHTRATPTVRSRTDGSDQF